MVSDRPRILRPAGGKKKEVTTTRTRRFGTGKIAWAILGAKARAALLGSYMVRLEDVRDVAVPVMTHRVITTFAAQAEGLTAKHIVQRLVEETSTDA